MANGAAWKRVPTVRPRVGPAGRAVLLLAVCAPDIAGRRLVVAGHRVHVVRFGKLGLVLSFVDQASYSLDEIERRRTDLAWVGSQARLLESAVERVRASVCVLPMRLLTIFADSDALEASARENYARWSRALTRLGHKRECAIHLFAGPHTRPGPEAYVARVSQRASRSQRLPALKGAESVVAHAQQLWQSCSGIATAMRRISTSSRGSLWSASLLIDERDVPALETLIESAAAAAAPLGVTVYLEPPRSPFTFV